MQSGFWDIHNHILPGLDDGAGCIEESFRMTEQAHQHGIRHILFTPHHRKGMFEVSNSEKVKVFLDTVYHLRQRFPDIKYYLGCEYYVNSKDACLDLTSYCVTGTRYILIEFAPSQSYQKIHSTVKTLRAQNMHPILAHVERYACFKEKPERIRVLRSMGARIQINADSLMGSNGFTISHFCKRLLKYRCVDYIASDAHNVGKRIAMLGKSMHYVEKTYGVTYLRKIFEQNPKKIFEP